MAMTMMEIILYLSLIAVICAFALSLYFAIRYVFASLKFEKSKQELLKYGDEGRKALEEIMKRKGANNFEDI